VSVLVCADCAGEIPPWFAYRERREYSSYRTNSERRHTQTDRILCRDCVDAIKRRDQHKLEPGQQGTLL
jgi:hypothetical protein